MTATFDSLRELDCRLVAKGFYSIGPWWLGEMRRLYDHPTANTHAARVGRGGKKSQSIITVGFNELLFGNFDRPKGEIHYWTHVSENKEEAGKSLRGVAARAVALGIEHEIAGDTITFPTLGRGYKVLASRVGALSGWRAIGLACDELAKWSNEGSDPSAEVIASGTAMMVTHTANRPKRLWFSSPLGASGFHFDAIERGDTHAQIVSIAPTWTANEGISEQQTHEIENDERVWAREYAAEPAADMSAALNAARARACLRPFKPGMPLGPHFGLADMSQGRGDDARWYFAGWYQPTHTFEDRFMTTPLEDGSGHVVHTNQYGDPIPRRPLPPPAPPEMRIWGGNGFGGRFAERGVSFDHIVAAIAKDARDHSARVIFADDYLALPLESAASKKGLKWNWMPWSNKKGAAIGVIREWLKMGCIAIEPGTEGEALVQEMISLKERVLPSGALSLGARSGYKDDRVACLINAGLAQASLTLPGSPYRIGRAIGINET